MAAIAVWIPLLVWIVGLLNWMIQGEIDPLFGGIGILVGFGLGFLTVNPPNPDFAPFILLAVLATMAIFLPMQSALNKRALVAIDMSMLEKAYQQLEERPNNFGAQLKIAKLIYQRGLYGHAIAIADTALKNMPEEFFTEEHKLLARWKASQYSPSQFRALSCVECGMGNPPGSLHCSRCGARFLLDQAKGKWVGRTLGRKLMAAWSTCVLTLIGIPLAAGYLPPTESIVAISAIMVLVVIILFVAFSPSRILRRA